MHRDFIAAGSQIILTNSFGGTKFRLKLHGYQDRVLELNQAAAQLAREEADQADNLVVVGGSMGPSGEIMFPLGDLEFPEACAGFAEQAAASSGRWSRCTLDRNDERLEGSAGCGGRSPRGK